MARQTKLRFKTILGEDGKEQYEAHIARNGRFYGFCAVKKCDNDNFDAWYVFMLIPGGWDFIEETNPVSTLREAKRNARKIVETIIADFQGVELVEDK